MPLDFPARLRWGYDESRTGFSLSGLESACQASLLRPKTDQDSAVCNGLPVRHSRNRQAEACPTHGPKILRTLFPADSLRRNRRGGPATPARILGRDGGLRSAGHRPGESAGARGRRQAAHRGPRFRRAFQPAAADSVRRIRRAGSPAQGRRRGAPPARHQFRRVGRRHRRRRKPEKCRGIIARISADSRRHGQFRDALPSERCRDPFECSLDLCRRGRQLRRDAHRAPRRNGVPGVRARIRKAGTVRRQRARKTLATPSECSAPPPA